MRFLLATLLGIASVASAADKPNIVLIMADDLGYEALGTYGSASYKTPVLDRLAATGMKFAHCYSQPLCTPSRVQIMTGRYNQRNYKAFGILPKTEITFGHLMQEAGYKTAVAGKWQLHGTNTKLPEDKGTGYLPEEAGFDEYCLWQVTEIKKNGERYADPFLHRSSDGLKIHPGKYGPDISVNFINDFMETNKDNPFFVYFPMALTHDPFVPTPDSDEWADGDRYRKNNKHFGEMVLYMDKAVGRIVAKLEELGLRENTLVIFTGDNGTDRDIKRSRMRDGRVIAGNKGHPDDAGTRVPLIVNWPGVVPEGVVKDDLIDFSDFLPTLVEFGGATLPTDRTIDGRSFADQLRGKKGHPRDWIYCYYDPIWGNFDKSVFARDRHWKLYDDGRFYDIENDVLEQNPIKAGALSRKAKKTQESLQAVIDSMEKGD
ncbi:MAG: sulfatase-like hydrolase/transferase [Candidatus Hydrogenedentota bacterium]